MFALLRWSILVGLNIIVSVLYSFDIAKTWGERAGLFSGVLTFIVIFTIIDLWLCTKGRETWRKSLQAGVIISACIYLLAPFVPIATGALALEATQGPMTSINPQYNNLGFLGIYIIVIIDGLALSILAMIPVLVIQFFQLRKSR